MEKIVLFQLALLSDVDEVFNIYSDAIAAMNNSGIDQWNVETYPTRSDILHDIMTQQMYIGRVNGQVAVAYTINKEYDAQYCNASWHGGDNFIILHRLCVSPSFQHQGIASLTMSHIHAECKSYGIKAIRLDAFTLNPFAIALYEHLGYQKRGEAQWSKGLFNLYEKSLD